MEQILAVLEDTALLLQKAQTNLKKCPKSRFTKGYIETRLKSIEDYWNTFKKAHEDLVRCVPKETKPNVSYFVNEDYFIIEDLYICIQADLKDLLLSHVKPNSADKNVSNQSISNEGQVKLPTISLPVFSGIYEEWPAFQDLYVSLVHENCLLSNVQKFYYLKSTLTGAAESLLTHIQVTDDNYHESWNMLKARYGNKRIIVNSIMKRLFLQKKIPTQSSNYIKCLLDTTTECINCLKNLKLSTDSWDPMIIFLVVQKLDPETHRDWEDFAYRGNSDELSTWKDLHTFLETKFRTLEFITPPSKERNLRRSEYAVHISTSTSKQTRICAMCKESHTLCHCREFTKMEPSARCEYVKNNKLCFNCLAPGHAAKKCRYNVSCRICHKRHHTLVHQASIPTLSNQPDNIQTHYKTVENPEDSSTAKTNVELSSHHTATVSTGILATALVPVKDEVGHVTLLRALIDNGSQATFITERAAQKLQLKRSHANGTISGVGSTKTNVKQAAEVELLSRHDASFNLKIRAYIMSTRLTTHLPSQNISSNNWPHLKGLVLADPTYHQPGRIDMLLGVDVCCRIMKCQVIKGPPGTPCAQNTSLGWILFGNIQEEKQHHEMIVMHLNLDVNDMLKRMWEYRKHKKEIKSEKIFPYVQMYKNLLKNDSERCREKPIKFRYKAFSAVLCSVTI